MNVGTEQNSEPIRVTANHRKTKLAVELESIGLTLEIAPVMIGGSTSVTDADAPLRTSS